MSRAQPWLPEECLAEEGVTRLVGSIVADWGQGWFARAPWQAAGVWAPEAWPCDGWTTLRDDGRIAVRGNGGAILRMAFAMLGEPERPNLTTRDLRLLRRVSADALDDLHAQLAAGLPARDLSGGTGPDRWGLVLAMAGEPLLSLSLDRHDLCLLARRTYAPVHAAGRLDPVAEAVAEVRVPIAARIGRASLAIDQIGALEPGDILVLDREADDLVDLVVAGVQSHPCSLTDLDGAMGLIISNPQ